MQHKGYNYDISGNVNSTADKFKFNGIEKEEALGLNLYEMDMRQYDPTIARWTSIDPVTHHSNSTYNAFDNNPIFWTDPSGADGECGNCDENGQSYIVDGKYRTREERNNSESENAGGTYQISERTIVDSNITFNPEREGDNRGQQVVSTEIRKVSRFLQDEKIIEVNESVIYESVISDDNYYAITSNTIYTDKVTKVFGRGGKLEQTIQGTNSYNNIDFSNTNELHRNIVDATIKTSAHYNKAVPLLTKEFHLGILNKISSGGGGIDISGTKIVPSIPGNPGYGALGDRLKNVESSSLKAQAIYRDRTITTLKKVSRIKL